MGSFQYLHVSVILRSTELDPAMLSRGDISPPSACWQHSSYSPVYHQPSLQQGPTAAHGQIGAHQDPRSFSAILLPPSQPFCMHICIGLCHPGHSTLHLSLLRFMTYLSVLPLDGSAALWCINYLQYPSEAKKTDLRSCQDPDSQPKFTR